jgi:hypothetical protein
MLVYLFGICCVDSHNNSISERSTSITGPATEQVVLQLNTLNQDRFCKLGQFLLAKFKDRCMQKMYHELFQGYIWKMWDEYNKMTFYKNEYLSKDLWKQFFYLFTELTFCPAQMIWINLRILNNLFGFLLWELFIRSLLSFFNTVYNMTIVHNKLTAICPHWICRIGWFPRKYSLAKLWILTASSPGLCGNRCRNWKEIHQN